MTPTPTTAITPIEDEIRIHLVPTIDTEEFIRDCKKSLLGFSKDPRVFPPRKFYWEPAKTVAQQPPAKPLKERKRILAKKKK